MSFGNNIFLISILLVFMLLNSYKSEAQFYNGSQVVFGKNRVQYSDFLWSYYRFNSFDVYYYLNGQELALHAADYAYRIIPTLEKRLGNYVDNKLQFIVFNSLSDLKQSNLGLMNNSQYNVGGITHIIGNKVFIYFDGDKNHFEQQIRAGISRILLEKSIYGTTITAQVKNNTIIDLPEWYLQGLISYYSKEWSTSMDNQMMHGILSNKYKKFNQLYADEAVLVGHSFWRFIAIKYGEDKLNNIIFITRQLRNIEKGFQYVLNNSFNNLVGQWQEWYYNQYKIFESEENIFGNKLDIKTKKNINYYNLILSPDNSKLLYVKNKNGVSKLYHYDFNTKKKTKLFRQGIRSIDKIDYSYPLANWHPNGRIINIINEHKGLISFNFYDTQEKIWTKQDIFGFQKILDFDYSPDGKNIIMSAVQKGQSDIYLYNIAANSATPITNDLYNDINPKFIDNQTIVFSSNRINDTLQFSNDYTKSYDGSENNDLFIYKIDSKSNLLHRVERSSNSNEHQPKAINDKEFIFLSDKNGIENYFKANVKNVVASVDTTIHYQLYVQTSPLSNFTNSVLDYDINTNSTKAVVKYFNNGKIELRQGNLLLDNTLESQISTEYAKGKLKESENLDAVNDSTQNTEKITRKRFVNIYQNDSTVINPDTTSGIVVVSQQRQKVPFFREKASTSANMQAGSEQIIKPPQPRNYLVEYSINDLVSQLDFTSLNMSYQPYLGYSGPIFQSTPTNAFLSIGATDLLEDYRLVLGTKLNTSLVNNEYLLGFSNLKKRLDKEIYFHRSGFDVSYSNAYIRHKIHDVHFVLKYPFNEVFAIKNTVTVQHNKPISMALNQATAALNLTSDLWAIEKLELIYDNSIDMGVNILHGTRFKIFGEFYQLAISEKEKTNMIVVGADFRNYIPISKKFIWANRLAASTSFGKNKLLYYMGGADGWILPKFNDEYLSDQTQDYAFQTLATSMRGFKQNIRSGNSFAIFSSELRLPIFSVLYNKPIKYEFLKNFQIVAFADAGSAWQGLNPLSEDNTYFTKVLYGKPISATVKVQHNPFVAGYGFGVRTTLFGYFIKADYAWGIEDGKVYKPMFYLSLNLDF